MVQTKHQPVLIEEIKQFVPSSGVVVDGTVGDGGHLQMMLGKVSDAQVIGIDRDPKSIARTKEFLSEDESGQELDLRVGSYADLPTILKPEELAKLSFVLLDLGYSSAQIENKDRGFSFQRDGLLDMRYNQSDLSQQTAAEVINQKSRSDLQKIFREYGEERFAARIAKNICESRKTKKIKTTGELASLIERIYPPTKQRINPATKTFQALRIYVNQELSELKYFVDVVLPDLPKDCIVAIISFHSLEDRIVKRGYRALAKPGLDKFGDRIEPTAELLHKDIIVPSEREINSNPRSRSAKLRVIKKIA